MVSAIIVAAGQGVRMKDTVRKQYLLVEGRAILGHTILAVDTCDRIDEIMVVIPPEDFDFCSQTVIEPLGIQKKIKMVAGGTRRQDSVFNGLQALNHKSDFVVIHDGVRPFVRSRELAECIRVAEDAGACIFAIPASDTLKRVDGSGVITETIARDNVWLAQTPQVYRYDLIIKAHKAARQEGFYGTDDALLVERLGIDVKVIAGSSSNIKITTPEDLTIAQAIFGKRDQVK